MTWVEMIFIIVDIVHMFSQVKNNKLMLLFTVAISWMACAFFDHFMISNACNIHLSYDVASESEITPCIKIDKPLVCFQIFWKR